MMSNAIQIQVNEDDMPLPNKHHVAYFDMSDETVVAIKYIAVYSNVDEINIVNNVKVVGIEAVYDEDNNNMPVISYTLTSDDAEEMQKLIAQMISDIK